MKPAITNVVHIAPEASREMDGIDRVVKDLVGDVVENEVRDAIGNAIAPLDDTPQDHAGSDAYSSPLAGYAAHQPSINLAGS
jgi:hypothetical protein